MSKSVFTWIQKRIFKDWPEFKCWLEGEAGDEDAFEAIKKLTPTQAKAFLVWDYEQDC